MKLQKKTIGIAVAAVLGASTAMAAGDYAGESFYIEAPVVSVRPLVEIVQVSTPQEICWNEQVQRHVRDHSRGPSTATIVGTVLGAAIGNNVAHGDDRKSARIAGALLGGAIGRDVGARNAPGRTFVTTERRCETEYVSEERERVSGYRVRYVYEGREFVTRTARDPGDTLRLRVSVAPIDQ